MDRDLEIHRLTARLRALRRFGLDLCLGHIVSADNPEPVYIGRLGLTDSAGRRLLLDWRSPAAEPFFGATHANPMGLASRRRYRWTRGRISDYWDEVFTADGLEGHAALDDQSAFIASLGSNRSARMRDVLGTIQADQDAIIRAGSRGALVVDGGPGTGKTVVALHRSAYLLYSDPRLGHRRGGVLFVGPHQPYLAYVADVLPSLGEEGVQTCTLRDLVAEGAAATPETDPEVARLKSSADLVKAIEAAVRFYEEPPVEGDDGRDPLVRHLAERRRLGRGVRRAGTRYPAQRGARPDLGGAAHDPDGQARRRRSGRPAPQVADRRTRSCARPSTGRGRCSKRPTSSQTCGRYPPTCACALPGSAPTRSGRCSAEDAQAWTVSDLPLLDAARQRLGDPEAARRQRRRDAAAAAEREQMADVVDNLIEADDDEDGGGLVSMLRGQDLQDALVDETALPSADPDLLAGPFAHVVVDEAQELTDAEWQMLLLRCPSRSFTIVGDRAQARHGFTESWQERLERVGLDRISLASLSINYRTPEEVMAEAEPVIRAVLPDANVPTSIRSSGVPVVHGSAGGSGLDPRHLARRARRGDRLRHRRSRVPGDAPRPVADPGTGEGTRVRPGRPRRPGGVRRGHRGSGRPLRRDDPGDPATRHPHHERGTAMTGHAVVIAGGGPTGMMLAAELALAGIDVAIVERRASQDLAGSRGGGLHARTIEVLDQRGIADRFLSQGQVAQVAGFSMIGLDISDFPTRHPYGLALWQNHFERILAGWVAELGVPVYRGREVTGFTQDDAGVSIELTDGQSLRAQYLAGCDGGRSLIRKAAGIEFPGWDPSVSSLVAEVETGEEPEWGIRRDDKGTSGIGPLEDGKRVRVVVSEQRPRAYR